MKLLSLLKNTNRAPQILVLMCFLLLPATLSAQTKKYKEADGFVWTLKIYKDNTREAKDQKGNILIPNSRGYTWIAYTDGLFNVRKGGKGGVCDLSGKEIISPDMNFDFVDVFGGIIKVKQKGVEGAFNLTGKEIISFDRCYDAVYGLNNFIKVVRDGKEGACDMNGNEVVAPIYKELYLINGAYQYKDADGSWKPAAMTSSDAANAQQVSKQLQTERDGFQWYLTQDAIGCYGAQNQMGEDIIPLSARWKNVYYSRGYFIASYMNKDGRYFNCCVYDSEGREIIGKNRYNNASLYSWDDVKYFEVEKDGKKGICDITGREIVSPQYETLYYTEDQGFTFAEYKNDQVSHIATNIFLPGLEKNIPTKSAIIQRAWLEKDTEVNGRTSLKVSCDFSVEGMRNQIGYMELWIKDSNGKWHNFYGNATSPDGISYKSMQFIPPYDTTYYTDSWIFVYNADLKLREGTKNYEAILRITDTDRNVLAENPPITFTETVARQTASNSTPHTPAQNYSFVPNKKTSTAVRTKSQVASNNNATVRSTSGKTANSGEIYKQQTEIIKRNAAKSQVAASTYNESYKNYEKRLKDMYEGNRTYNDRDRRNYQDKMRSIRQECKERGITLFGGQSKWETWDGKCKEKRK